MPAGRSRLDAALAKSVEFCRLQLKPVNAFTRVGPPPMPPRDGMAAVNAQPPLLITYTGFSAQAQAAFAYAASLIEAQVQSRIQLKVTAVMKDLNSPGLLGV